MANLQEILVVEDNKEFMGGCSVGFCNPDINAVPIFASDYDEAIKRIESRRYNGAIIDCFFPKTTGTGEREIGRVAIEKMLATDTRGQRIEAYEKFLENSFDKNDPELRRIIRYIGSISEQKPLASAVVQVVKLVGAIDKEKIGKILKDDAKWLFKGIENFKDYYLELRNALEADEHNQALGILVAEECQARGIPFVLATSTYHHDALTQPIQNYCGNNSWQLVDCSTRNPNEKAQASFWQRAYDALLREMGGSRQ